MKKVKKLTKKERAAKRADAELTRLCGEAGGVVPPQGQDKVQRFRDLTAKEADDYCVMVLEKASRQFNDLYGRVNHVEELYHYKMRFGIICTHRVFEQPATASHVMRICTRETLVSQGVRDRVILDTFDSFDPTRELFVVVGTPCQPSPDAKATAGGTRLQIDTGFQVRWAVHLYSTADAIFIDPGPPAGTLGVSFVVDDVKDAVSIFGALQCDLKDCTNPARSNCSKCKQTRYCSQACQMADWPEHKIECDPENTYELKKRQAMWAGSGIAHRSSRKPDSFWKSEWPLLGSKTFDPERVKAVATEGEEGDAYDMVNPYEKPIRTLKGTCHHHHEGEECKH